MSIDLVILCVVMALYIGWKASAVWHIYTFRNLLEELKVPNSKLQEIVKQQAIDLGQDDEEDNDNDLPTLDVKIEQHPEGLFAYRKADGFFIAMGKDRETLMENLVNNLNNVRVIIAKEDGGDLIYPQKPA